MDGSLGGCIIKIGQTEYCTNFTWLGGWVVQFLSLLQLLENDTSKYDETCRAYSPGESLEVGCFSGLSVKAAILESGHLGF